MVTPKPSVICVLLALLCILFFLAFHSGNESNSMWNQAPAIHNTTTSWGVCMSCADMEYSVFVTKGCIVRVVNAVVIIAPIDSSALTLVASALEKCGPMSVEARMATPNERSMMLHECSINKREDALTMLNYRRFDFHPYHNVMSPTGALPHFSVLNATQHLLAEYNLRLPPRMYVKLTKRQDILTNYKRPGLNNRFMEYILSHRYGENTRIGIRPEDVNVTIDSDATTAPSCSLYHTIGLWMTHGLFIFPKNGMTTPIPPQWAHDFRGFREMVRSRSISDFGDAPLNHSKTVLYVPRPMICEADRIRFIPTVHKREFERIFLRVTNGSEVVENKFIGDLSMFSQYFHEIRSRKIIFGAEGAFFTWVLVARPESVWVIYYRAPHKHSQFPNYQSHGFFTSMARTLPDLKLVVFVVTNGVSPPISELERAVSEPFSPYTPKFVGADATGSPPSHAGTDPLIRRCEDIF